MDVKINYVAVFVAGSCDVSYRMGMVYDLWYDMNDLYWNDNGNGGENDWY